MKVELFYRLLLRNEKGELVKDTGLIPSHSFVIQFLELLRGWFTGINADATDVNGVEQRIYSTVFCLHSGDVDAGVGVDTYGVLVGSNNGGTPEGNEDYNLDTKILHSGEGEAGKLDYQDVTFVKARVVGVNVDLDVSRSFINETANPITVKEIGIVCRQKYNAPTYYYHLLLRDVVSDFSITVGYTLTVVYTLRTKA